MKTGYSKNVSNLETITIILESLGSTYNPNQPLIAIDALRQKLEVARGALSEVDRRQAERAIAIDQRQIAFRDLDRYLVNIRRMADVIVNDPEFSTDLRNIIRRLRSRTASAPVEPDTAPRAAKSSAQRSFDDRIEVILDVKALLETQRERYQTPDPDYSLEAVTRRVGEMRDANNAVKEAIAALAATIEERNTHLFDPRTGIQKLSQMVKDQLAVKPGVASSAYRQVRALRWSRKR